MLWKNLSDLFLVTTLSSVFGAATALLWGENDGTVSSSPPGRSRQSSGHPKFVMGTSIETPGERGNGTLGGLFTPT